VGYIRQKKIHKLTFDDTQGDLAGLEVRLHSLTVGQLLDMGRLADQAEQSRENTERFFADFAQCLVSWNVEDEVPDADGVGVQAIPATLDGVRSCDLDFITRITKAWMEAISGVPDPLDGGSNSGQQSPEASIPMEPLSPNRQS
jgi:hypothetical protein